MLIKEFSVSMVDGSFETNNLFVASSAGPAATLRDERTVERFLANMTMNLNANVLQEPDFR